MKVSGAQSKLQCGCADWETTMCEGGWSSHHFSRIQHTDERQWLSAGYAWHSRPRTTTLSSNLRNAGAMSQDERRLFPVRRDLEHLTSKLPRE